MKVDITDFTENATPPTSSKSRNSNSSVQLQIAPKFLFEFVPRDTEEFAFVALEDFGGVAFSVEKTFIFYISRYSTYQDT